MITIACAVGVSLTAHANSALEQNMLSHVEKILVVDSINVAKDAFLDSYRLRPSTGSLLTGEEVENLLQGIGKPSMFAGQPSTGFTNEYNDYLIWAQPDTTGYLRLAESVRLINGKWDAPRFTSTLLNFGMEMPEDSAVNSNAAFPFMADDGQSLYFAADNDKSLGGFDIFLSRKDPSEGKYLIPLNLGMPFNSAYDDYMMVLDRQTGVGWWATDRNQLEDEVTIYIYVLTDERVNVEPDDENLHTYASLSGWESLLDEDQQAVREKYLADIAQIQKPDTRTPDFTLEMPGGQTYRYFSDFKNNGSSSLMKKYLAGKVDLEKSEKRLAELRERFASEGGKQLAGEIQKLERETREKGNELRNLLSDIYLSEGIK